jgi:hypothetical protein
MVVVIGRSDRRSWLRGEPVGGVEGWNDAHHRYPRVVLALHTRQDWRGGRRGREERGEVGGDRRRDLPRLGFQNRCRLLFRFVFCLTHESGALNEYNIFSAKYNNSILTTVKLTIFNGSKMKVLIFFIFVSTYK